MKHFFYAVYVLFYTGAVLMAGVFVGQFLERRRLRQERAVSGGATEAYGAKSDATNGERKVAVMSRRQA
jgi:hypothetical protein